MTTAGDICIIDSLVWLPLALFSRAEASIHREFLTCTPKGYGDETPDPIKCYAVNDTHVGFPIDYGMRALRLSNVKYETRLVQGETIDITKRPEARGDEQHRVWSEAQHRLTTSITGLIQAPTGFGKTVTACHLIAELKRATAIVVTTNQLAIQWRDEIKKHLDIDAAIVSGKAEGDKMTAPVVIVLVHQLCMKRDHSASFYDRFGFVVWDEVHRMGAREFSQSLKKFKAEARLGLSATPRRKDGCEKMFLTYFGNPFTIASQQTMPCDVWEIQFQVPASMSRYHFASGGNTARLLNQLARCERRNEMIAHHTKKLYNAGRTILILSDRIEQLGILKHIMISQGINENEIGMIAGFEFDPISGTRMKITQAMIDVTKASARIILATYGMAKEGLDIPRLDAGIDASPRADGEQAIGRIRRFIENKLKPVWFTIHDTNITIFSKYFHARIRDYRRAGATIRN
jgi:superfamily II DNA or RNA helicase